jgi:hypothetical protein
MKQAFLTLLLCLGLWISQPAIADAANRSVAFTHIGNLRSTTIESDLGPAGDFDTIASMRAPWAKDETWYVYEHGGYNVGPCHFRQSPCGGDEFFAFDLVFARPNGTGDTGGRAVFAPVAGTVSALFSRSGKGQFVKIATDDGYVVHLYHLMGVPTSLRGQRVTAHTKLGYVFDQHESGINHLHLQVTNGSGASIPIKIAGKTYIDLGGQNQWHGRGIRNLVLWTGPNFNGDTYTILSGSDGDLRDDAVGNDNVSSLRVNPGCTVTLYRHINYGGDSRSYTTNTATLEDFNNVASSVRVGC